MKYLRFTVIIVGFSYSAFSQPILNQSNGLAPGTSISIFVDDAPILTEGSGGTNQVWDFSSLSSTADPSDYLGVDPAATPYSSHFPVANVASQGTDFTGNPIYNYFTNNGSVYQSMGYENSTSSITYTDPIDILHYPFHYTDQFFDTYDGITGDGGVNYGDVEIVADGYGVLQIPDGTFSNCLRIREIRYDSLITPVFGEAYTHDTSYKFYVENYPEPLCQVNHHHALLSGYPFDFNEIYWQKVDLSGIVEQNLSVGFSLFPNPCNDFVIIEGDSHAAGSAISITNIFGESIQPNISRFANGWKLDTHLLPEGIYSVRIQEEKRILLHPFIKMKGGK
jgi:hypothetical protein